MGWVRGALRLMSKGSSLVCSAQLVMVLRNQYSRYPVMILSIVCFERVVFLVIYKIGQIELLG